WIIRLDRRDIVYRVVFDVIRIGETIGTNLSVDVSYLWIGRLPGADAEADADHALAGPGDDLGGYLFYHRVPERMVAEGGHRCMPLGLQSGRQLGPGRLDSAGLLSGVVHGRFNI